MKVFQLIKGLENNQQNLEVGYLVYNEDEKNTLVKVFAPIEQVFCYENESKKIILE